MLSQPNGLSEDVLRLILVFSAPSAIRTCQLTCRLLRDLVKSDVYIQYLLELDACGYVEPVNPRRDLTFAQKLEIVRSHRSRWDHPDTVVPTAFELDVSDRAVEYKLASGIYVRGLHPRESVFFTRQLRFFQLPSPNRGTTYKHWEISDLGLDVDDFSIDPEQDLLVLLEERTDQPGGSYRIYLRTMMTNEVHPKTSAGHSIIDYQHPTRLPSGRNFYIEVSGHLLAILFCSRSRLAQSYVAVWDWTTGEELLRVDIVGGMDASAGNSFTLLSDELLVVAHCSESSKIEGRLSEDGCGSLDVYQFNRHSAASEATHPLASFALPLHDRQDVQTSIRIQCAPTNVTQSCRDRSSLLPSVFDLSPDNRLLCIEIRLLFPSVGRTGTSGTLCVPSSLLLNLITDRRYQVPPQSVPILVPWADWAGRTSWVDTSSITTYTGRVVFGQRMAELVRDLTAPGRRAITILDFDPHRLKSREMRNVAAGGVVRSPGGRTRSSDYFPQAKEDVFCAGMARASTKYVENTLPLDQAASSFDELVVDDEHGGCMLS